MSIALFDSHCDTAFEAWKNGVSLRSNALQLDLERLCAYSPCTQVFAVCTGSIEDPCRKADAVIEYFLNEIKKNSDIVSLCLNFRDIEQAATQGQIAALISIEGAEQISSLDAAYARGVRIVHPTWNFDNSLCGAALGSGEGLTESGKSFIIKAQGLGIAIDLSHISERGFYDVLEISTRPVIAGHSNSKALCDVPRNISDEQFKALMSIGGGVGINLYPEFLGMGRDIDAVTAHIEHFLSLGGEKNVFLGCDLDGIDTSPQGISGVQDIYKIYEALLRLNYKESTVRDIFRNNLYEIMEKML